MRIKNLFKISSLFVVIILLSCERDDICAETTATTPRLIVEFYDASSPDDLKSVSRLTVYGEGLDADPIDITTATLVFNSNVNTLQLPLFVDTEGQPKTIRYVLEKDTDLRLDTDTATDSNIDILEITYTPEFVYVSRACGYKSIFTDLTPQFDSTDMNNWVTSFNTISTTIDNENTTHVKIFH